MEHTVPLARIKLAFPLYQSGVLSLYDSGVDSGPGENRTLNS